MISLSAALLQNAAATLAATFNGGTIRVFAGERPVDASHAETGTLLGVVTVNAVDGAGLHFQVFANGFGSIVTERAQFRGLDSGANLTRLFPSSIPVFRLSCLAISCA